MQALSAKHLSREDAEEIAVRFLGFLAREPDHLSRFLALTGMSLDDLKQNAGAVEFQLALFDYMLGDEALLLAFCANENLAPDLIAPARHKLAAEQPHPDEF